MGLLPMRNFVENLQWFGLTVALLVFNVTPHSAHPNKMRRECREPGKEARIVAFKQKDS
jgi:hypothetical protein